MQKNFFLKNLKVKSNLQVSNHNPISIKSSNVMKPFVGSVSFFVATAKKKSSFVYVNPTSYLECFQF